LTGTNFAPGATVTLGGSAATAVTVVSATTITATTPAHAAGVVNVVVTNPGTQSATLVNGFTYLAPGPSGGFTANLFIDMNVPDPVGTAVTSALMSSGTIGVDDGWRVVPTAFTVGAHQIDRAGAVTVDGVVYPPSHPSKSLALDHASNFSTVDVVIPAGHRAVSVAGYITFGVPHVDSSSRLFDYVGIWGVMTGGYVVLQLNNGAGGVYALNIEASEGGTHHSPNIVITPGATYWCVLKADYGGGTAYLNVYDATQGTLVGAVTTTMTTGEDVNQISIGNGEFGTASGATSYFENMLIDYEQGVFPLGPIGNPGSQ